MTIGTELAECMADRMNFLIQAVTLRELRGWPNTPIHNASIIYELYGWSFDEKDAAMIRADTRTRTASSGEDV